MSDDLYFVEYPEGVVWTINYGENGEVINQKTITDPKKSVAERLAQLEKQNAILEANVKRFAQVQGNGAPETKHLECNECGTWVTSPVPQSTITTAYILCPDCLESIPDDVANLFFEHAAKRAEALKEEQPQ